MRNPRRQSRDKSVIWILDESVTQDKRRWPSLRGEVKNLKELKLLSTKDEIISDTLDTRFPKGKVIITANKHPNEQGDYFKTSRIQGLVKFSSDIRTQLEKGNFFKKFQQMVKNESKLLGAEITLTKTVVIFKKGSKTKVVKYKQHIF